jgi:excisionase family DNA binding protein
VFLVGLKLLRIQSVAKILDVSEDRVYALAREGILPHVRLGRQVRVDSQTLEEFIRKGGKALPGGWRREE